MAGGRVPPSVCGTFVFRALLDDQGKKRKEGCMCAGSWARWSVQDLSENSQQGCTGQAVSLRRTSPAGDSKGMDVQRRRVGLSGNSEVGPRVQPSSEKVAW